MMREPQREIGKMRALEPDDGARRLPLVRGDCGVERPCPFVSCRHHLFLDVNPYTGSIKLNFPDLLGVDGEPFLEDMPATCALDVADEGGVILEQMGDLLNLTRERARQLEVKALENLHRKLSAAGIEAHDSRETVGLFENPFVDDLDD